MLFKDAISEFIFECQVNGLADETIKSYSYNTKRFLQIAEEKYNVYNVEDLNSKICKRCVVDLRQKGYEESYINTIITTTNLFLQHMYEEGHIEKKIYINHVRKKKKVIDTFTDEEIQAMAR